MAEEKKDFSAAENIIAPSGAFCDLNGGKADTGGTSSVGYFRFSPGGYCPSP